MTDLATVDWVLDYLRAEAQAAVETSEALERENEVNMDAVAIATARAAEGYDDSAPDVAPEDDRFILVS